MNTSTNELETWLSQIGLGQYASTFTENDIDFDVIAELSDSDLMELGLSLGHRRKLAKALRDRQVPSPEPQRTDQQVAPTPAMPTKEAVTADKPESRYAAEKRFMTLMFCDLADSTRIASALDIEENHEINRAYQETCTDVINRFDGYVAKYMGDGILAYFGFPVAREDDAERSIGAGIEIMKAIEAMNAQFNLPQDIVLAGRIGIATGPVVIEPIGQGKSFENAVVGEAPNLAARLEGHAGSGQVMIGPDTYKLVEHAFEFVDCGEKPIKGYSRPMQTWQVLRSRSAEEKLSSQSGKHLTRLIGRDEELGLLKSRWQRSLSSEGQVVLLSGDAGVGKSRMIEELLASVTEFHQCIRFFCRENYRQSPLFPVINNLLREAGISSLHSPDEKRQKLTILLTEFYGWESDLVDTLLAIAVPDSVSGTGEPAADPAHALQLLQAKLADTIVVKSVDSPIILVIEDAHWIDASSHKLLDLLTSLIETKRVLLVISFRTESPVYYAAANVTNLSLTTLTREHANTLVREIARNGDLSEDTIRQISGKSDGVPLFIEEIAKSLVDGEHPRQLSSDAGRNAVPDTLQASLMAKLDQLGDARILAQCGAVIGNTFEVDIASHIANLTEEILGSALDTLVSSRITVREAQGASQALRFRHALLRDAAYDSLLRKNRTSLHARIAEYLEATYGNDEGAIRQIIAHHYALAGLDARAFRSWLAAGETALKSGATTESVELLDKASALLDALKGDSVTTAERYQFHMCRGKAQNAAFGAISKTAHEAFSEAADIAASSGEVEQQIDALDYLFGITFNAGNIRKSIDYANQMLDIGAAGGNKIATISGHQGLGMAYCTLGEFDDATRHLQAALDFESSNIEGINCYPSMTLDYLSYVKCIVGDDSAARSLCNRAITSARSESPHATMTALNNSCFTEMMLGNHDRVRQYSEDAIAMAEQSGQRMLLNRARLFNNLSRGWLEKSTDCLAAVVDATDSLSRASEVIDLTYLIGMTAELQLALDQTDAALESIEQALMISAKTEENFYKVELLRLQAQALRVREQSGESDPASLTSSSSVLEQAISLAQEQQSNGWLSRVEQTRQQWSVSN